jgi:hypothetical protein
VGYTDFLRTLLVKFRMQRFGPDGNGSDTRKNVTINPINQASRFHLRLTEDAVMTLPIRSVSSPRTCLYRKPNRAFDPKQ